MTFGDKLRDQRRKLNYTQEQLADILDVSRQSISKWESNIAYPETDKIIKMGKLFECSIDYLLNDEITEESGKDAGGVDSIVSRFGAFIKKQIRERKSEKTVFGMPLYHIGLDAVGFFAIGLKARGFFALGFKAKGVAAFGLLSIGIISFGLLSLGAFALGVLSAGLAAIGSIALGVIAIGAVSVGIVSIGALSVGEFSAGAMALGKYVAVGDRAKALLACGESVAAGSMRGVVGPISEIDVAEIKRFLDDITPSYFSWAKEIFKLFVL